MAIKLVSIGGGSVTLDIPSTASNLAMTIPASAGTLPYVDSNGILQGVTSGIKFPATQVSSADANVLDDYEEGTWTPAPICTYGSITYSSVSSYGTYVKIGRNVFCWFRLYFTASTNTGNTGVSGLPFAINTSSLSNNLQIAGTAREDSSSGNLFQIEGFPNGATNFQVLRRYDNGSIVNGVNAFGGSFMYQTS